MIVVNSIDCYLTGRRSKLRFRRRLSWTTYGNGSCVRCDHFLRATKPAGAGAGSLGIVSALPGSWLTTAATDKWKISFISTAVTTYFLKIDMCIVKIFTRRKFERFFSYFCDRCNFSELLWKKKEKIETVKHLHPFDADALNSVTWYIGNWYRVSQRLIHSCA